MVALTLCIALTVPAADPDRAAVAGKVHAILNTHCYRCHGQDGAIEGGFNFVLDFKTLVARKKVVPGDAAKSKIYKRLISDDNPMPPSDEKSRPNRDEIALIKEWIDAGAPDVPTAAAKREFLTETDVLRLIRDDLDEMDAGGRRFSRYFSIADLANAGLPEDQLQTYRHGLAKLVNSLSWQPDIVVPKAIDPARIVFRIDLRDYRWSAAVWQKILAVYPYGVILSTPAARAIFVATGCELPVVRADWFVFAASRPPLYHEVLQLPDTDAALEKDLKIDTEANIREGRVVRAGFNGSGVSRNNRLIERHTTTHGAYWKSYDFAGNIGRQNLFDHPLGPGADDNQFRHDGGEIIFNLPNGLQAYLLVDGKGRRIDEGPTKIVSVKNRPDPSVINGISCMTCHARGMLDKADQVRAHAEKNAAAFGEDGLKAIRALYPPEADFRALLKEDAERFRKSVEATGSKVGETEPVAALALRFEAELDLSRAAGELGLSSAALLRGLDGSTDLARRLGPLKVEGGTVQRQVFVAIFDDAVRSLRLGAPLAALNRAIAERTEAIRITPRNARAFVERADLLYDKGDFDGAVADYSEALRLGLREADVYRGRGMAHASRGDFDGAIADYDEALRREPRHVETLHNRGLAHGRKGDTDRALADLGEALRLEPENAAVLSDRGFLRTRTGDLERALTDLDEALRLRPRSPTALERRGDVYRRKGDFEKAVADCTAALALAPRFAEAYRKRALARVSLGALEQALTDLGEAIRLEPRNADAHADLALLLATSSAAKVRDARKAMEHAMRANAISGDKEASHLRALAAAHAENGQFEEAVRVMCKAVELAPEKEKGEYRGALEQFEKGKPYRTPEPV
jgi:tetratricopeptide (TPR) repeat protein/mono/diheme cytochrome c family protein